MTVPLRRIHDQYRDFAAESIAAINAAAEPRIASAFGTKESMARKWPLSIFCMALTVPLHVCGLFCFEAAQDLALTTARANHGT